jgi:O-glycosyl hydrolase
MNKFLFILKAMVLFAIPMMSQTSFDQPTKVYLMHSSGNHLECDANGRGVLRASNSMQMMTFIPDGKGYYNIMADGRGFLSLDGSWDVAFVEDSASSKTKYSIEPVSNDLVRLRCKANGKCLGTDGTTAGQWVYSDKSGEDVKHHWFFSDKANAVLPIDTAHYLVNPHVVRQHFKGWGVSLCWWARMCGEWDDKKIDEIITWLVSPTGLNYRIFRYNIGGGDDPLNRNCTEHHMGEGKGLRAEMEGFKDFSGDEYHWDRDAGQRKIMLKIKEKRPDAVFEAFSNSAPYYMTYSGCVAGNTNAGRDNLRPEYYEEFAHYLVDVCKHYKEEYGIEFKTLEPFNEPVTDYWGANGSQEGCHFNASSQVNFLKVLAPILEESGLSTIISASDETSVSQSVSTFKTYMSSGVLPLVGQWNTHTYGGNNADRARISHLAYQAKKPLWMSEVGEGGSGIGGNLNLAKKLIDDMRYIQPEAWVDWQYMEENNDQWCTIRGDFGKQTYSKVKNYYVRQQCTRFIKEGYDIITSLNSNTLAALNPTRDTLVVVLLNEGTTAVHNIDLSFFEDVKYKYKAKAYRTSATENMSLITDFKLKNNIITTTLPSQSITTFVIAAKAKNNGVNIIQERREYLIIPRHENGRAISAKRDGKVTIQDIDVNDPAQRWMLAQQQDGAYILTNANGLTLTSNRANGSTTLIAQEDDAAEQTFLVQSVDPVYFKILSTYDPDFGLDLVNEKTSAGTTVAMWEYDDTSTPTHRQWMLFPLPSALDDEANAIDEYLVPDEAHTFNPSAHDGIYDLSGRCIRNQPNNKDASDNLRPGIYILRQNGRSKKFIIN